MFTNPTINPPRLSSSAKVRATFLHSRSPSRSPTRSNDPVLRDLSPTKTLLAFSSHPEDPRNDALTRSIHNASPSQRALGIKVARACADLRSWTTELDSWPWPGTFDVPEHIGKKQRMSDMTILSRSDSDDRREDEYWGCLPVSLVERYELRIDEVCTDFDAIDFEELKQFVLSAHSRAGIGDASIDDSIGAIGAATDLQRLDDFTALMTATILRALPYLPKLTRLLDTWTIRLSVLRSTPKYLRDLKKARTDLNHGWAALAVSDNQASNANLSPESLEDMKGVISTQVYSLGKRLDGYLDVLEGRPEVVPDAWIDDFEDLEHEYGDWVVKAERRMLENEWKSMREQVRETVLGLVKEDERNRKATNEPKPDLREETLPLEPEFDTQTLMSPTVTTRSDIDLAGAYRATHTLRPNDAPNSSTMKTLVSNPTHYVEATPRTSKDSTSSQARYMPILVDYTRSDQPTELRDPVTGQPQPLSRSTSVTATQTATTTSTVKQRAAFLNGDIEKDQSLIKSKSAPIVRPFEHASNAFTRLFKKEAKDLELDRKRQAENDRSPAAKADRAGSIVSGSSKSGSAKYSTASKDQRMEYMDMVRAPSESRPRPRTPERGRDKTSKKNVGKMAYGDLVMAMPPAAMSMPAAAIAKDIAPARKSEDLKKASSSVDRSRRSRSPPNLPRNEDSGKLVAMDLVGPSLARRSEEVRPVGRPEISGVAETGESNRPMQRSSDDVRRSKISAASPLMNFTNRDLTALPREQQREAHSSAALEQVTSGIYQPGRRSVASMKEKNVPEIYKPTGLAAPLPAVRDQFPTDWPLSSPASEAEGLSDNDYFIGHSEPRPAWTQRAQSADRSLVTNDFEEFFVRSLPDRSGVQRDHTLSKKVVERDFGDITRPSSAPGFRPREYKVITESTVSESSKGGFRRPRPVSMVAEEDLSDDGGILPAESSNNAAGYFGHQGLTRRSKSAEPASPKLPALTVPSAEAVEAASRPVRPGLDEDGVIRRASTASIEAYPRDRVQSIEIPRRSADALSLPQTPEGIKAGEPIRPVRIVRPQTPKAREAREAMSENPMDFNGVMEFPSPPSVPNRASSLRRNSASSAKSSTLSNRMSVSSQDAGPLNSLASKQRQIPVPVRAPIGTAPSSHTTTPASPVGPGHDHFDRHVSQVLDRVQAPIKFKSRAGAVTPVAKQSMEQRLRAKAERQGKNMTLAPADITPKKASPADSEVKLYHLTQVGRAEPIKLYVRLVGEENERVMVRVGGGWADLADYLRQYAEHHGSRTISEGALELQKAEAASTSSTPGSGKRNFSGPAYPPESSKAAAARSPVTPVTSKVTTTTTTTTTTKPSRAGLSTHTTVAWDTNRSKPRLWIGGDTDEEDGDDQLSSPQGSSAPGSTKSISRPSTATAALENSRLGAAFDPGNSPGLDGTTRAELPEQKAKWVEGMIEKAMKSASVGDKGEKAGEDHEKYFGQMGKVGATRRVVFRQSSGTEAGR